MEQREFKCRMCGACCRIKDGIVRVSDAEVARIAAFLGLGEAEFIERETLIAPDRIVCDYAGFRTLDTVVLAKKVFGSTRSSSSRSPTTSAARSSRRAGSDATPTATRRRT